MIAVVDYGCGNIFSVKNALNFLNCEHVLTADRNKLESADKIILPGVGAAPKAMQKLNALGLTGFLRGQTKKLLGICLGMQLLFDYSDELGGTECLKLIPGSVEKIADTGLLLPQMGWNNLKIQNNDPVLEGTDEPYVYFVHSYKAVCEDEYIVAYCEYGEKIPAVVRNNNVMGMQFHPEKSAEEGLRMLRNFVEGK